MKKIRPLSAILARLSKREKMVFYCAVFFVSITMLDRLIIHPIFSKIRSLDEEINGTESGIRKSLHILAHKDRILSDSAKYESFLHSVKFEEEKATSILKEIETLADKAQIYLVDMKPAGLRKTDTSTTYSINLNCEAQMEQLAAFMHSVESSKTLLTVEKYQISPKSNQSSVTRCRLTISTIFFQ